jgi:serine/threonine protein kinase
MTDSLIGRKLGRYQIVEKLGQGGMGMVYKAVQASLHRTVAIKVLPAQLALDTEFVERFRQEAQVVARLQHDGIVHIYDIDQAEIAGGLLYFIVMELVDGQTLRQLVARGRKLEPARVREIGRAVGQALEYAHQRGIVHRDVKSANVMITAAGKIKLMDFGIAKAAAGGGVKTVTGSVLGTPEYMAPEQAQSGLVTAQSDIYSLGILLYELTTGRLPHTGTDPFGIALKHLTAEPIRPREIDPQIPEWLEAVILKALIKDPARRYLRAADLVADLDNVEQNWSPTVRTPLTPPSGMSTVAPPLTPPPLTPSPLTPPPLTPPPLTPQQAFHSATATPISWPSLAPPSQFRSGPAKDQYPGAAPTWPATVPIASGRRPARRRRRLVLLALLFFALVLGLLIGALSMRPRKVELAREPKPATQVPETPAPATQALATRAPLTASEPSARPVADPAPIDPTRPSTQSAPSLRPSRGSDATENQRPRRTTPVPSAPTPAGTTPEVESAPPEPPRQALPSTVELFEQGERHELAKRYHSAREAFDRVLALDPDNRRARERLRKVNSAAASAEDDLRDEVEDLLDELVDAVPERELDELAALWGGALEPATEKFFLDLFAEGKKIKASFTLEEVVPWDRQARFVAQLTFVTPLGSRNLKWRGVLVDEGDPRFAAPLP